MEEPQASAMPRPKMIRKASRGVENLNCKGFFVKQKGKRKSHQFYKPNRRGSWGLRFGFLFAFFFRSLHLFLNLSISKLFHFLYFLFPRPIPNPRKDSLNVVAILYPHKVAQLLTRPDTPVWGIKRLRYGHLQQCGERVQPLLSVQNSSTSKHPWSHWDLHSDESAVSSLSFNVLLFVGFFHWNSD